jgi:hypothetical protein
VLAHDRQDLRRGDPLRGRVVGDLALPATASLVGACAWTREGVAAPVLAVEHEPRAGLVLALQPRLVEERDLHRPVASATVASTSGRIPRRRTGASGSTGPPRPRWRTRPAPARPRCAPRGGRAAGARAGRRPSRDRARPAPSRRAARAAPAGRPAVTRAASARAPSRASRGREARRSRSCGGRGPLLEFDRRGRSLPRYSAASSHHQFGWPPTDCSSSTPSGASAATPRRRGARRRRRCR